MVGWHHQLNGPGFRCTPGVGDGQGGLACCGSWGRKELDMTEQLNWTELKSQYEYHIANICWWHDISTNLVLRVLRYKEWSYFSKCDMSSSQVNGNCNTCMPSTPIRAICVSDISNIKVIYIPDGYVNKMPFLKKSKGMLLRESPTKANTNTKQAPFPFISKLTHSRTYSVKGTKLTGISSW